MLTRRFGCAAHAATLAFAIGLSGAALADDAGRMTRQVYLERTGTPAEEAAQWVPSVQVAEMQFEAFELAECGELIRFRPLTAKQLAVRATREAEHANLLSGIAAAEAPAPEVWSYEQEVPPEDWH
jgi:hypothetical protein